jgi:DUF1680 family protein
VKQNRKTRRAFALSCIAITAFALSSYGTVSTAEQPIPKPDGKPADENKVAAVWHPVPVRLEDGLLSERVGLWRTGRMPWLVHAEGDFLLAAFEKRPGAHPWQGEHFGKWLHAATLAYEQTQDEALLKQMREMIDRLLATQDPNGYLGTYTPGNTFMAMPENKRLTDVADAIEAGWKKGEEPRRGWDTWTLRYNLYGLLTYERFHPDARIVKACEGMADLLIETYGEGKRDLTKYGTQSGVSAATILESIVMLYERTRKQKYLEYGAETERALFNGLLAAQHYEGNDWCYFTKANEPKRPLEGKITCCASSGPRAVEMYAHDLVGVADGAVSLASLAPCRVTLPEKFGDAVIEVGGSYPVTPSAVIRFKQANGSPFPIEFRDPAGSRLVSVKINGKPAEAEKNERGFHRIHRPWNAGDEITIEFDYQLLSHIVRPGDDQHWVAFTYGPRALARKQDQQTGAAEPLVGKPVREGPAMEWLEPLPAKDGALPTVRIRGTQFVLQPYHSTGSLTTGPQTYFKLLPAKDSATNAR